MQKWLRFKHTLAVFFLILVLALAGCGGSESRSSSEAEPSTGSPTGTSASTAAVTEPPTDEEIPPAVQAAQQAIDQAASVDAKEEYTNALQVARSTGELVSCEPTRSDMLGPFYEPDAPVRTSVGSGYVLSGAVLAADSCEPIRGAWIEFWLANPEGVYDDAHRATGSGRGRVPV